MASGDCTQQGQVWLVRSQPKRMEVFFGDICGLHLPAGYGLFTVLFAAMETVLEYTCIHPQVEFSVV